MGFSIVSPAMSSLGNASGFDMRLEDRGGQGHEALMAATQQLLQMASKDPVLASTRVTGLGPGPELTLTIARQQAAALRVNFSEVAPLLSTAIRSGYVGNCTNTGWVPHVWVQADRTEERRVGSA